MDPATLRQLALVAPTPIAQLAIRAQNELTAERQHHNSYYMFELWLRLLAYVSAARLRSHPARNPRLDDAVRKLARPNMGDFATLLRAFFKACPDEALAPFWTEPLPKPAVVGYGWVCSNSNVPPQKKPNNADFVDALTVYRNTNIGHAALRNVAFYRAGAEALFDSIGALIVASCQGLSGNFLAIEAVSEDEEGRSLATAFELIGITQTRLQKAIGEPILGPGLKMGQVYFMSSAGPASSMHPWLYWRNGHVLTLNRCNKNELEYLDYCSGETFRRPMPEQFRALIELSQPSLPEGAEEHRVGRWVGGYEIQEELGRGGMGTVYRALQASLGMPVALKILPPAVGEDTIAVKRFEREIDILKRCEHRNIVSVLDAGVQNGERFYAMEIVSGCTLGQLYATLNSLPPEAKEKLTSGNARAVIRQIIAPMVGGKPSNPQDDPGPAAGAGGEEFWKVLLLRFAEVAEALHYLHSHGVVHRDIKPANIMLTEDASRAVVMDLGVAKVSSGSIHTKTGSFVGTLRYASREQVLRSLDDIDFRADLYSLGATMYELFTLSPLYFADETTANSSSDAVVLGKILDERPAPPRERNPALKEELAVVLEKLLEKQADRRFYSSASEVAADLRSIYEQRPIRARAYTSQERRAFELYDSVRAAARTWDADHRNDALLWEEDRVRELRALEIVATFELSDLEKDFVIATTHHAEVLREVRETREAHERALQEQVARQTQEIGDQRRRVRRIMVGIVIAGLVVLVTIAKVSLDHVSAERDLRAEGEQIARHAKTMAEEALAQAYLLQGQHFESDARWDDAALFYSSALALTEGNGSSGARGLRDRATEGLLREASLPLQTRLRWSKKLPMLADSVVFSPDTRWVLVTGDDATARLISTSNCSDESVLREDDGKKVLVAAFSPNGRQIALGTDAGIVELWDAGTRTRSGRLTASTAKVRSLAYGPDGRALFVGDDDGAVRAWDTASRQRVGPELAAHGASILAITVAADGSWVATAGDAKVVRRWAWPGGREMPPLEAHTGRVLMVASSGSETLVSAGDDDSVVAWDLSARKKVVMKGHSGDVRALALSDAASVIASGGDDNTTRLWDGGTGALLKTIRTPRDEVFSLAFAPRGGLLAMAEGDGTVEMFELDNHKGAASTGEVGNPHSPLLGSTAPIENLAFAPAAGWLASSGDDGAVRVWDLRSGRQTWAIEGHGGNVVGLDVSVLGLVASGDEAGIIRLLDPAGGAVRGKVETNGGTILGLEFSHDGRRLAFGSDEGMVGVYELDTKSLRAWKGHADRVTAVRLLDDGALVASASSDRLIKLWGVDSESALMTFAGHRAEVLSLARSHDGRRLASGSRDRTVRLWDVKSGAQVRTFSLHSDIVFDVAFSPDDRMIASASKDGTVIVADASSGAVVWTLRGHTGAVYAVEYSPDGKLIGSAGDDRKIRLWSSSTGRELGAVAPETVVREGHAMVAAIEARTGLRVSGLQATHSAPTCESPLP